MYRNPSTNIEFNTPVSETLYGKWLIRRINKAKDFYDSHGTIEGFEYSLLDGQPAPVNSGLIMDENYGWYSKKAWKGLDWASKVLHFEKGLDVRLQQAPEGVRTDLKKMQHEAQENRIPLNPEYLPAHKENGEEIYSFRKKQITDWKEDDLTSSESVFSKKDRLKKEIQNLKRKLKQSTLTSEKKQTLESQIST